MAMPLKATHNLDEVLAKVDAWEDAVRTVAMPIALNKLGDQARTAGYRKIRDLYGLSTRDISPYIAAVPAAPGKFEYVLVAKGAGFPLSLFRPRQTSKGVSVVLKGHRILIPHAFLKAIRGSMQVWARGSYNASPLGSGTSGPHAGKRRKRGIRGMTGRSAFDPTGETFGHFTFGRNRFPITLLRSTTPPAALTNPDVIDAMNQRIEEQAPKVIKAAIKFVTGA